MDSKSDKTDQTEQTLITHGRSNKIGIGEKVNGLRFFVFIFTTIYATAGVFINFRGKSASRFA